MNLYVSLSRYCTALFVYRRWIAAISVLLAISVGAGALRLERTPNNRVFFGAKNPELASFQNLEATYSETNQVLVAIAATNGDMFSAERLAILAELTESLWRIPFSTRVDSIANFQYSRAEGDDLIISDLVPPGRLPTADEADAIRRIALGEPLLTGLLISSPSALERCASNARPTTVFSSARKIPSSPPFKTLRPPTRKPIRSWSR